ncbi:MAG: hypothetical protein GWN51_08945, partial [Gemmatimonadetes bacterium]|nr:hypothetical protein [Gemmatimonadota bacterium]NIT66964.1 hypothetical protein [Gemmatimonadota bacterium]NIV23765.1 hypothetical protein [Gemmatimonadota bacterium]NIW75644.1 hypothetical protein [Gemmatimonadota bacterium]NIY35541.1 hypothetical protein [Gemmatimonadota bacterium]
LRHASALAFLLGSVGLMACEAEPDALQPGAPVFVDSDPRGADIWLDDGTVGGLTP